MDNEFKTIYDNAFHGWEQKINGNGVIYYVNNEHQMTSWLHPYLEKVYKDLGVLFSDVRYAAYRTALKLRTLQLQLGLQWINVCGVKKVFPLKPTKEEGEEGRLGNNEYLTYEQVLSLTEKALQASDNQDIPFENIPKAADLILSLLVNLYDKGRSGKLGARSIKNALVALCGSRLSEKYKFYCSSLQDEHSRIPKEQLTHLIDDLMQIPYVLKESKAFGIDVTAAVDSCFSKSRGPGAESVGQSCFYAWLFLEPQTLVWLPTLHRTIATENVRHAARCSACRIQPIRGFRYRCLVCFGYNLCQNCFLLGRVSLSHKVRHPVKEYCLPMTATDSTKAWLKMIKNKLLGRRRGEVKTAYLPVEIREEQGATLDWEPTSIQVDHMVSLCHSTDSGLDNRELYAVTLENRPCEAAAMQQDEPKQLEDQTGEMCIGFKTCRPKEFLGQPFDCSSPIVGNILKEPKLLSKRNIDDQQRLMAMKIEELRQENRILQKQLQAYQGFQKSDGSDEGGVAALKDCSKVTAAVSPISPISEPSVKSAVEQNAAENPKIESEHRDGDKTRQVGYDTLAIVGAFTPVRGSVLPAIRVEPPTPGSRHISLAGVDYTNCSEPNQDYTDCTEPNGLQYRSSDMSLLSCDDSSHNQDFSAGQGDDFCSPFPDVSQARLVDPPDEGATMMDSSADYKPSDMSLLCLGLAKLATVPESEEICYSSDKVGGVEQSVKTPQGEEQILIGLSPAEAAVVTSMDISNIHPENSPSSEFFTHDPRALLSLSKTPEQFTTQPRRRTIEPVHMSTPVTTITTSKRTKSLDDVNSRWKTKGLPQIKDVETENSITSNEDKENDTNVTPDKNSKAGFVSFSTTTGNNGSESKGVLTGNNSENKPSFCREMSQKENVTSKLQKTISMVDSQTMPSQDREELHQIMADFEKECKISDFTQSEATRVMAANDSSVMVAAFNVGDVMSEFVQAVAKCDVDGNVSKVTEMTHF